LQEKAAMAVEGWLFPAQPTRIRNGQESAHVWRGKEQ